MRIDVFVGYGFIGVYIGYTIVCITCGIVIFVIGLLIRGGDEGGWVGVQEDEVEAVCGGFGGMG